jgi:hypothetical protein
VLAFGSRDALVGAPRTDSNKSPGLTFFDDAGDEAGGLKIRGDRRAGPSARRHLLFDQHRGDQVIGIISDENETGRTAGMTIWDRPDTPLPQVVTRYEEIQRLPQGPERQGWRRPSRASGPRGCSWGSQGRRTLCFHWPMGRDASGCEWW